MLPQPCRAEGDAPLLRVVREAEIQRVYGDVRHAVVVIIIIVVNGHAGGIGEVQKLPRELQLHIVAGEDEVGQRVILRRGWISIAVGKLTGLVDLGAGQPVAGEQRCGRLEH